VGVSFFVFPISAEEKKPDVQIYLPLLERNSLGRKALDVSYSVSYEAHFQGKSSFGTRDVQLVFDAETGKYREEVKVCNNPKDPDVYSLDVDIWNGKESVSWSRSVSKTPGSRALGSGVFEYPGSAMIQSQPAFGKIPSFVSFFYDTSFRPFAKSVPELNPKLGNMAGDTLTIETRWNKFEFAKKTGALVRLEYNSINKDNVTKTWKTYDFSKHVECSGIWIPLRVVETELDNDGKARYKGIISVNSKTLRLIDKVEDSLFNVSLPAGCGVDDRIRKKVYTVTTVDNLPNDVEAVKQSLEKLLKQAEEQKAAVEQKK
jgi:hypothetical protein